MTEKIKSLQYRLFLIFLFFIFTVVFVYPMLILFFSINHYIFNGKNILTEAIILGLNIILITIVVKRFKIIKNFIGELADVVILALLIASIFVMVALYLPELMSYLPFIIS